MWYTYSVIKYSLDATGKYRVTVKFENTDASLISGFEETVTQVFLADNISASGQSIAFASNLDDIYSTAKEIEQWPH